MITTNEHTPKTAYAAGFLEGVATSDSIGCHMANLLEANFGSNTTLLDLLKRWTAHNRAYMDAHVGGTGLRAASGSVASHVAGGHYTIPRGTTLPFWEEVGRVLAQLDGVLAGYNSVAAVPATAAEIMLLNMQGDLSDVISASDPLTQI
jgi:hypothetical protein